MEAIIAGVEDDATGGTAFKDEMETFISLASESVASQRKSLGEIREIFRFLVDYYRYKPKVC